MGVCFASLTMQTEALHCFLDNFKNNNALSIKFCTRFGLFLHHIGKIVFKFGVWFQK